MNSELVRYKRQLDLSIPQGQTIFLWGARKTGKTTFLKKHFPNAILYDLLKSDIYLRLAKTPSLFREEVLALEDYTHPIIVDEVQKIPLLLDEIHWLIENTSAYFILCGSSARKLKKTHANLLGGRAWKFQMFPLTSAEIPDLNLVQALNRGFIPSHYNSKYAKRFLKAYIQDYLSEEIKAEGLARSLPVFSKFLDAAGYTNGQLINYSNIARDCGIDPKTIKEYFLILEDTMLGHFITPYRKQKKRQILSAMPKFYFFDTGISSYLKQTEIAELKGSEAGILFEQFILMELFAYRGYTEKEFNIHFWRTKTGLEVDIILDPIPLAIEVKINDNPSKLDLKGLIAFQEEHPHYTSIVISTAPKKRKVVLKNKKEIIIFPWKEFLELLWTNKWDMLY